MRLVLRTNGGSHVLASKCGGTLILVSAKVNAKRTSICSSRPRQWPVHRYGRHTPRVPVESKNVSNLATESLAAMPGRPPEPMRRSQASRLPCKLTGMHFTRPSAAACSAYKNLTVKQRESPEAHRQEQNCHFGRGSCHAIILAMVSHGGAR